MWFSYWFVIQNLDNYTQIYLYKLPAAYDIIIIIFSLELDARFLTTNTLLSNHQPV